MAAFDSGGGFMDLGHAYRWKLPAAAGSCSVEGGARGQGERVFIILYIVFTLFARRRPPLRVQIDFHTRLTV